MTRTRWAIAALALVVAACNAVGGPGGGGGAAPSGPATAASPQLAQYWLRIVGTRDVVADLKYPCASAFDICLPVNPDGTVTEPILDLCPTIDTPQQGQVGTGTWTFVYDLYTDSSCLLPANADCPDQLLEPIGTGTTINNVQCTTTGGKTFIVANRTMEGAMTFPAGSWIAGGYHFKFVSGTHPATTYTVTSVMHMYVECVGGPLAGTIHDIPISLGTLTFAIPANDTSWHRAQSQNDPLTYMGSLAAPDVCLGGLQRNNAASGGVTFITTVTQSPPTGSLVDFQFHYRVPAGKGKPNYDCTDPTLYLTNPNLYSNYCSASWSNTARDP